MSKKKTTLDKLDSFSRQPTAHPQPTPDVVPTPSTRSKGNRGPFSTYVDRDMVDHERQLALQISAARGYRVSVADLVGEALVDLLAKYGVSVIRQ